MRDARTIAAGCALLAGLLTPAALLAQEGEPAPPQPEPPALEQAPAPSPPPAPPVDPPQFQAVEQIGAAPTAAFASAADLDDAEETMTLTAEKPLVLDASASSDPEGAIAKYEWDLDGDGSFETDAGESATYEHTFFWLSTFDLKLRVTDAEGQTAEVLKTVTVQPEPAPEPASEPEPAEPEPSKMSEPPRVTEKPRARSAQRTRGGDDAPEARAAADASVTIVDFDFRPGTVNVNVGDSVTWTNDGDEPHTASADNGSFDTGTLESGESGSATFDEAGTFSYFCRPHPFMQGTVRVAGSGGGGDAGSSQSGDDSSGAAGDESSSDSSGSDLANTGADLGRLAGLGLLMLLMGAALGATGDRRRRSASARRP